MELKKSFVNNRTSLLPFFSLFTSFSTLICCAIPALLVSMGLGATLVGLVSTFPSLIILSENKSLVFGFSGFMLALSAWMQFRARHFPCPIDPEQARACRVGRIWSKRIILFSISIWLIGAGFAFLPKLF